MKTPKTLSEVRDGLCDMYARVMNDPKMAPIVHEGANALGKVVASTKVYLEYCALAKAKPSNDWKRFIEDAQ